MPADIATPYLSTQQHEENIRQTFLDRIWIGVLVMAVLAVPASVSRSLFTGWQNAYSLHVLFLGIVLAAFAFRRQLSFRTRANLVIVMLDLAAVAGLLGFGLLGSAWWWMLIAGLLTGTFYSIRLALIHTVGAMLMIGVTAVGYISGTLVLDFDANDYVLQYSSWLTMVLGPALLTVFVFWAFTVFQTATQSLLLEVDSRRAQKAALIAELEQAQADNKTLEAFIPICSHCKKIRDDKGFWENVEAWMHRHADMKFTHALCPPCGSLLYGELWEQAMRNANKLSDQGTDPTHDQRHNQAT